VEKYQHYCAEHKISAETKHPILVTYTCLKRHSKAIRTAKGQSTLEEKLQRIDWQSRQSENNNVCIRVTERTYSRGGEELEGEGQRWSKNKIIPLCWKLKENC